MTKNLELSRKLTLPDRVRLARFARAPELGPKILFFTGGTALRALSQRIIAYTHNSVHLVTPMDSGGSSAEIRRAFGMLAVGDIRNRIMALADRSLTGNQQVFNLFVHRLDKSLSQSQLYDLLWAMVEGEHPLVQAVPDPMRKIIRAHLRFFAEAMPVDFDLKGASVGNLILTGGYLNYGRHIDPVIYLFSRLVEARGVVRPITSADLHLVSVLQDDTVLVGQHLITGKEAPPIASSIKRVFASANPISPAPAREPVRDKVAAYIREADLICYPMGSFYSSLVANLLVPGVGDAVAANQAPKIYVPNTGLDPEQLGLGPVDRVRTLLAYLEQSRIKPSQESLLDFVLLDAQNGDYGAPLDIPAIENLGVGVVDYPLITEQSKPFIDPERLLESLLSFA